MAAVCFLILFHLGCSPNEPLESSSSVDPRESFNTPTSVGDFQAAFADQRWDAAWSHSDEILLTHGDDPELLRQLARAAYELGKPSKSADLLVDATSLESYQDGKAVQQAAVSLLGVGRLFDAIDLLSRAVNANPQQYESRRWLFDFLVGLGDHHRAMVHGRKLVQQRRFDAELLLSLGNVELRRLESESMATMAERNPADKRPLFARAQGEFDAGDVFGAAKICREIVDAHPSFVPAQLLLGRALVISGEVEQLENWSKNLPDTITDHWQYWAIQGQLADGRGHHEEAVRAYWEAAQRYPDVIQVWAGLASSLQQQSKLQQMTRSGRSVDVKQIDMALNRSELLKQFHQSRTRYSNGAKEQGELATEMARTLMQLGRLWEAEAWTAIAMSKPGIDSDQLVSVREEIVRRLRKDLPWQLRDGHPELQLDFSAWPLPENQFIAQERPTEDRMIGRQPLRLVDEAEERDLIFDGHTSDSLGEPGIPLHATLGCGGGAIDYDRDGWTDLYFAAAGGTPLRNDSESNALFRNLGGLFRDESNHALTVETSFGQGIAVGDVNEDGFPDLFLSNFGGNRLLINQGDGTFIDATKRWLGSADPKWSTSAAIADLDNDSIADLIVLNYCRLGDPADDVCVDQANGVSRSCSPIRFPAESDQFYRGTSIGKFEEMSHRWKQLPNSLGRGLGVLVGALDDRAGNDVLIANDMTSNHFYTPPTSIKGPWVESAMTLGLAGDRRAHPQGSMGIATTDVDGDGALDIYVTNFENEYNTLYEKSADSGWRDSTVQRRLAASTSRKVGFGTEAIDFNHDGIDELVVTNGHIDFPVEATDAQYAQPMQVFRQSTSEVFELAELADEGSYFSKDHVGRALWTIDADRDSKLDFVVTHQTENVALIMNRTKTSNRYLTLRLVGNHCSRDAIGTVVEVIQGDRSATKYLTAGDGFLCSNQRTLHFGLRQSGETVKLKIRWPDGREEMHESVTTNKEWLLIQGNPPFESTGLPKE